SRSTRTTWSGIRTDTRATSPVRAGCCRGAPSRSRASGESQPEQVGRRRRAAEQVPLPVVDADLAHERHRLAVLDPLGDRLLTECAREAHDRLDDRATGRVARRVADELTVDLQVLNREPLQVREAAVAGAEVVERECAADRRESLEEVNGR